MGARPSSFRKAGGFLNNVDGVITGYTFTDEFNGEPFRPGRDPKTKKERFHSLYWVPTVLVDGATEDVNTTLFAGRADDWDVSEDGHTLTPVEDGRELGAGTAFAKFITSLVEAGFPETNLPEDVINYECIVGTRVRFVQKTNVEDTKKLGKRKDKKTGREYDRQDLVVDQVYDLPGVETKSNGKTAKPAGKPASTSKPPAKAAVGLPETGLEDLAKSTLLEIISDADGKIVKSKLSMKVLTKLMKHPQREDVRKLIFTDDFLAQEDGWSYNKAKQLVEVLAD